MATMSSYLVHEAQSAFGLLKPERVSVIATYPGGMKWFVVVAQSSMQPLWDGESQEEAIQIATSYSGLGDLAFLANVLKGDHEVYYASPLSLKESSDGLDLQNPDMVLSSAMVGFDLNLKTAATGNADWQDWKAVGSQKVFKNRPLNIIVGADIGQDQAEVLVMLTIEWGALQPNNVEIQILDGEYVLGKQNLTQVLHAISASPEHEFWYADHDDLREWKDELDAMPMLGKRRDALPTERVYAYEGGPVLEHMAKKRPWLVEKDESNKPIPLRITQASAYEEFGEDGLYEDIGRMAAIYLLDVLTFSARQKIIESQNEVRLGQSIGDKEFVQIAKFPGEVVLEAMFDKQTPNIIGTRDWLNYRLWIEGELVIDVQPGNIEQYERIASLSPLGGSFEYDSQMNLSSRQVGELLGLALINESDGENITAQLPDRVAKFLNSREAEELASDANSLEDGTADIVDGIFVAQKVSQDMKYENSPSLD